MPHRYPGVAALFALLPAVLLPGTAGAGLISTLDEIEFWAGSGSNRSALVIDWNDGRDPLAWGYRWEGAATGEDMFNALAAADPRLFLETDDSSGFGTLVEAIGYDRDGDGFSQSDPADSFDRPVFNDDFRYWNYFTAPDSPYSDADGSSLWSASNVGFSDRSLAANSWDGWIPQTFGAGTPDQPFAQAAAVPEPGTWLLVLLAAGGGGLASRRRGLGRAANDV